jgi:hypothetical protein
VPLIIDTYVLTILLEIFFFSSLLLAMKKASGMDMSSVIKVSSSVVGMPPRELIKASFINFVFNVISVLL